MSKYSGKCIPALSCVKSAALAPSQQNSFIERKKHFFAFLVQTFLFIENTINSLFSVLGSIQTFNVVKREIFLHSVAIPFIYMCSCTMWSTRTAQFEYHWTVWASVLALSSVTLHMELKIDDKGNCIKEIRHIEWNGDAYPKFVRSHVGFITIVAFVLSRSMMGSNVVL